DRLQVADGDEPGAELRVVVDRAADADPPRPDRLDVDAGGDIEVGDRLAVAAGQGVELAPVDEPGGRVEEADRVIGDRAVVVHGGQPLFQFRNLVIAAAGAGQDLLELPRGRGGLLVAGDLYQSSSEGVLDGRIVP